MKTVVAIALLFGGCSVAREKICGPSGPTGSAAPAVQVTKTVLHDEHASSQPIESAKEAQLLVKLRDKRMALDTREIALAQRENDLLTREKRLQAPTEAAPDMMVELVRAMQPKAAAKLLDAMSEADAARLIRHLGKERASELLAGMDANRAAKLGKFLSAKGAAHAH